MGPSSSNLEVTSSDLESNRSREAVRREGEEGQSSGLPSFEQEHRFPTLAELGGAYIPGTIRYWGVRPNPILQWADPVTPESFVPSETDSESDSDETAVEGNFSNS